LTGEKAFNLLRRDGRFRFSALLRDPYQLIKTYFLMPKSTKNHPHGFTCGRLGQRLLNRHERLRFSHVCSGRSRLPLRSFRKFNGAEFAVQQTISVSSRLFLPSRESTGAAKPHTYKSDRMSEPSNGVRPKSVRRRGRFACKPASGARSQR